MVEQVVVEDAAKTKKKKNKEQVLTLKTVLTKMVPYASLPYAEHVLRLGKVGP